MKLYYSPGACSMAPHIVLNEAGVKYTAEAVDLKLKTTSSGDFKKVNPKGYVPALQLDNGQVLTEAAVIMQYIADQKPESNLIPKWGTFERYRCLEWMNFIATELHKGFGPLWNPDTPEAVRTATIERLGKRFDVLSSHLNANQFVMGDHFSIADAYLFTILGWSRYHKVDMTKWPALLGYIERMQGRSSIKETMMSEGLIK